MLVKFTFNRFALFSGLFYFWYVILLSHFHFKVRPRNARSADSALTCGCLLTGGHSVHEATNYGLGRFGVNFSTFANR